MFRRQVNDVIGKELRLITSTYASGAADSDDRRAVGEAVSGVVDAARPVVQDIRQQVPDAAAAAQQMNPLRRVEQNKLLGIEQINNATLRPLYPE